MVLPAKMIVKGGFEFVSLALKWCSGADETGCPALGQLTGRRHASLRSAERRGIRPYPYREASPFPFLLTRSGGLSLGLPWSLFSPAATLPKRATAHKKIGVRMNASGSHPLFQKEIHIRTASAKGSSDANNDSYPSQHHSLADDHVAKLEACAPRAMRMPSSCVRCWTEYAMKP